MLKKSFFYALWVLDLLISIFLVISMWLLFIIMVYKFLNLSCYWFFARNMINYLNGLTYFNWPPYLSIMTPKMVSFLDFQCYTRLWRVISCLDLYADILAMIILYLTSIKLWFLCIPEFFKHLIYDKRFLQYLKKKYKNFTVKYFLTCCVSLAIFILLYIVRHQEMFISLIDLSYMFSLEVNNLRDVYHNTVSLYTNCGKDYTLRDNCYRYSSFKFLQYDPSNTAHRLIYNRYCTYYDTKIMHFKQSDGYSFWSYVFTTTLIVIQQILYHFLTNLRVTYLEENFKTFKTQMYLISRQNHLEIYYFLNLFFEDKTIKNFLTKFNKKYNKKYWNYFFSIFGLNRLHQFNYVSMGDFYNFFPIDEYHFGIADKLREDYMKRNDTTLIWNFIVKALYHEWCGIPIEDIDTDRVNYTTWTARWKLFCIKLALICIILIIIFLFILIILSFVQIKWTVFFPDFCAERSFEAFSKFKSWHDL